MGRANTLSRDRDNRARVRIRVTLTVHIYDVGGACKRNCTAMLSAKPDA